MGRLKTHRPTSSSRGQCLRYQAGLRPAGARAGDSAGQIAAARSRGEIEVNCPLDTRRWGGGETEEPAAGHGLGVTEPPGRPGGCGRRGRTTPAGAAAQRPARAAVTGAEPTGLGWLGGASRKRGPWAPLCEGRGEGCRANPGRGGPGCAAPTASLRGAARLPTPPLGACPPPHAPCLGFSSYRKGITIPSPPTRHLALSPPPPLTSSSSPVGPSAAPHSPPQFADFRPPSASPSRRG
ncbi:ras-related protein Rap-2c isoform X1 [Canis lupus dingo]|uniref:ras-related protein Rap-2c isoform X1 n=1 Tax=Canis lupus dingo TaxID=286419 RepID=UPI0003AE11C3|nr:ras-related protein Rap-2c isoform X1 [Canis lupus dingo]